MHHYFKVLIRLLQKGTSAPVQKEKEKYSAQELNFQRPEMVNSHNISRSTKLSRSIGTMSLWLINCSKTSQCNLVTASEPQGQAVIQNLNCQIFGKLNTLYTDCQELQGIQGIKWEYENTHKFCRLY